MTVGLRSGSRCICAGCRRGLTPYALARGWRLRYRMLIPVLAMLYKVPPCRGRLLSRRKCRVVRVDRGFLFPSPARYLRLQSGPRIVTGPVGVMWLVFIGHDGFWLGEDAEGGACAARTNAGPRARDATRGIDPKCRAMWQVRDQPERHADAACSCSPSHTLWTTTAQLMTSGTGEREHIETVLLCISARTNLQPISIVFCFLVLRLM